MATSKQRREAERRRLQRQMERRAQQDARRRRVMALVSVLGVLVIVALVVVVVVASNDEGGGTKAGGGPTVSATTSPAAGSVACAWTKTKDAAARPATEPPATVPHKGTVTVDVTTNRGPMTFVLDRAKTPCTVASFVSLAGQKYYDGTSCHRLTSGSLSVLQCGDPHGDGSGGPGYQFKDELSGSEKYTRGVLAMANSGANTNGSQFFIVYKDSQLPPSYTVFGTVTKGLGVVDKVATAGSVTAGDGKPKLPITLQKVTVTQ